mgnify:FL=1
MHQLILESITDAIFLEDNSGNVVYCNKNYCRNEFSKIESNTYKSKSGEVYHLLVSEITIKDEKYKLYHYKEITKLYESIQKQKLDSITNLPTRLVVNNYLYQNINKIIGSTLVMLDIDYFKNINDTYGHVYGDQILSEFATLLKNNINDDDFMGRYGGEEFLLVLKCNQEEALIRLNRISSIIKNYFHNFDYDLTVSIGVTPIIKNKAVSSIVEEADNILYYVKNNGRDNVGYWDKFKNDIFLLHKKNDKILVRGINYGKSN